jgi:hypothetical protein
VTELSRGYAASPPLVLAVPGFTNNNNGNNSRKVTASALKPFQVAQQLRRRL